MKKLIDKNAFIGIFTAMSVISAICFRSARQNWVFVANTFGFNLPMVLLGLMVASSVLLGVLLALRLWGNSFADKKAYKTLAIIGTVLSFILSLFAIIYTVMYAISESGEVFFLCLAQTLREGALMLTVPFFALFYPKSGCKTKKVIAALSVAAVLLMGVNSFHPLTPYKITSDPMVIDNGSEYSIVFAANDVGSAYVEYTYEGEDYKVYDNIGGRLVTGKTHSIPVPYEHLRNNTYKISSTRVIEDFSYGSRRGKTVTSAEYEFRYNDTDNQTWLVISDWHTQLDKAYTSIANLDSEFDAVMLVGDSSPGVDYEEQIITNTVEFGGKVSGGTKPVLYVRGNHETRGAYADELLVYLGIDQLYYTADMGPYSFVVLDSGEDKNDSHSEYGGMTDYNTYRADMIKWLKGVEVENEKVVALSHAWQISQVEPELSQAGWAELDRIVARLIISGHEHSCRFIGENEGYEKEIKETYPDIIGYIDGGKVGEDYIASMLTLSEDGFVIKAVNNHGAEIINEEFSW